MDPVEGGVITIADCLGDWREEFITSTPGELRIYTTARPAAARRICLMQDRLYCLDVAMVSMGYFYPPQLSGPLAGEAGRAERSSEQGGTRK
ncbi:MAG TPA: hypothetical protein VLM89_17100 [Phycisphaerae bacterium]|nr:hypothetical protein [Phycisphaerae bacterium]